MASQGLSIICVNPIPIALYVFALGQIPQDCSWINDLILPSQGYKEDLQIGQDKVSLRIFIEICKHNFLMKRHKMNYNAECPQECNKQRPKPKSERLNDSGCSLQLGFV